MPDYLHSNSLKETSVLSVRTHRFDAVFISLASDLRVRKREKKKRLHFWVCRLKQLEAVQVRSIWEAVQ